MSANLDNSAVATGLEKISFHSNPKERQVKECSNYCMLLLISLTNKIMLKILLANHQQYGNQEFLGVQAVFQRDSGNRGQI